MAKKSKKKQKQPKKKPQRSSLIRRLRGWFFLALFFCCFLLSGALVMRHMVVQKISTRAASSSALVLSRPLIIAVGHNIYDLKLSSRLKRLGYRRVSERPKKSAEYFRDKSSWQISIREFQLPTGAIQEEQLVKLSLNGSGDIQSIKEVVSSLKLEAISLEPEIVSQLGNSSRRAVSFKKLEEFPKHLKQAILAIEDERFYSHFGIDPVSVGRALYANLSSGRIVQGGSTITQQLVKNLFLSSERTISRKIVEAFSAILLETAFTKDQILELYLNEVFLAQEGNTAVHGFAEASKSFFRKEVAELSLEEAATLAGLVKAPTSYSPRKNPDRAKKRRKVVLAKMNELGFIEKDTFDSAREKNINVRKKRSSQRLAPYFIDYLRKNYSESEAVEHGLKFHSELDVEYQLCAEQAVTEGLKKLEKSRRRLKRKSSPLQAALVSLDSQTNKVRAWVGGRNYSINQFDRTSQALRQPGSSFKPFVYLTAMDKSLNNYRVARTTSLLEDRPLTIQTAGSEDWSPKNYDEKFRGEVTLRESLSKSLNIPTINLATKVGVDYIARTAELFGFGRNLPRVPSLALGAGEVSPLSLARAYGGLSSGGYLSDVQALSAITSDSEKRPLKTFKNKREAVASKASTYVVTNLMQSVIENGTGRVVRKLGYSRPAAGKTGTSNESRDAWFAGYTPSLLTVVWVGFDDNSPTGLTGASGAAPIWTEYNKCVSSMEPTADFTPPAGVVFKKIDAATGLLATRYCPRTNVVTEVFVKGADPITPCHVHAPHLRDEHNYREARNNTDRRQNNLPSRPGHRKNVDWLEWFGL